MPSQFHTHSVASPCYPLLFLSLPPAGVPVDGAVGGSPNRWGLPEISKHSPIIVFETRRDPRGTVFIVLFFLIFLFCSVFRFFFFPYLFFLPFFLLCFLFASSLAVLSLPFPLPFRSVFSRCCCPSLLDTPSSSRSPSPVLSWWSFLLIVPGFPSSFLFCPFPFSFLPSLVVSFASVPFSSLSLSLLRLFSLPLVLVSSGVALSTENRGG